MATNKLELSSPFHREDPMTNHGRHVQHSSIFEGVNETSPLLRDSQESKDYQSRNEGANTSGENTSGEGLPAESISTGELSINKRWEFLLQFRLYSPIKYYDGKVYCSLGNVALLVINVIKVVLVSLYTQDIGDKRAAYGLLVNEGSTSLRHLLILNWDASWETVPYPPSHGPFAVYSVKDLADGINYAVEQYYNAESMATGYFVRQNNSDSINLQVKYFNISYGTKQSIELGDVEFRPDHGLTNTTENGTTVFTYDIEKEIRESKKLHFQLQNVLSVTLQMYLHSVRVSENWHVTCVDIHATVSFNDSNHNGQVIVTLSTVTERIDCSSVNLTVNETDRNPPTCLLVISSYIVLSISAFLEISAAVVLVVVWCKVKNRVQDRGYLRTDTMFGVTSSLLTLGGDVTTLVFIVKIQSEYQEHRKLYDLDISVVGLGTGLVVIYVSSLRFFKFNKSSSLLFKTVGGAFMPVVSFLSCVIVMFIGFWLSAYILFGPYHVKFTSPTSAADTLFSIINGDEIFATLANFEDQNAGDATLIANTLHACVYIFVIIFTVIVFNLLIALFNSAYEVIVKKEDNTGGSLVCLKRHLKDAREGQQTVQHLLEFLLSVTSKTERDQQSNDLLKNILEFVRKKPTGQQTVEDLLQNLESSVSKVRAPRRLADLIKHRRCVVECGCCTCCTKTTDESD